MEHQKKFDAFAVHSPHELLHLSIPGKDQPVKWSWACRHIPQDDWTQGYSLSKLGGPPQPADAAMVQVENVGYHRYLETAQSRRLRLYAGDRLVCVFGNRYATDVYEGHVLDPHKHELHLLTGGGMIGTVQERHSQVRRPTILSFLGYLADSMGKRINLKELCFAPSPRREAEADVVIVAGTSMSAGKTTVACRILHALASHGVPVAGCKLTGSASPRDLQEMRATGAKAAIDFSDYGFPSTYGVSLRELIRMFDCMVEECRSKGSEMIVMEVADGVLQRETQMLLESAEFRRRVRGVILAGTCSSSTLYAQDQVERAGLDVWAVSGLITNSPLFVREFASRSSTPVIPTRAGETFVHLFMNKLDLRKPAEQRLEAALQART